MRAHLADVEAAERRRAKEERPWSGLVVREVGLGGEESGLGVKPKTSRLPRFSTRASGRHAALARAWLHGNGRFQRSQRVKFWPALRTVRCSNSMQPSSLNGLISSCAVRETGVSPTKHVRGDRLKSDICSKKMYLTRYVF